VEGCDQVDTLYQKTYPGLALRPRTAPRARGKNFFFHDGDAVSSAAGAERPDVFSEMMAAASRVRRERKLEEHCPV
jgi:hypothetical protein